MTERQQRSLVALAPADMLHAQAELSSWCVRKIAQLEAELGELREHLLIAQGNGWKLTGLQASIRRGEKRIEYYGKLRDAVDAGYLVVPNFPIDVIAVRVPEDQAQPRKAQESSWNEPSFATPPAQLPSGEGRYVDEQLFYEDASWSEDNGKGGRTHHTLKRSTGYDEAIDMPFTAVKPVVMAAAARAMALKIFDDVGLVTNRSGRDPLIVGRILDPRGNQRAVTFFVAWWLNTEDL